MITCAETRRRVIAMREYLEEDLWCSATSSERALWKDVLEAVAQGAFEAQDLAYHALKTLDYDFPRVSAPLDLGDDTQC